MILAGMGIETVGDLLRHYPRRYIDRSAVERIRDLRVGEQATVIARVHATVKRLTRRRQSMVTVTISDGTGKLDLTFFNQPWAASIYKAGLELAVSGTVTRYRGRLQLANQEAEILGGDERELVHTGRITPVHPASDGIATRTIRELVFSALERLPSIPDPIPPGLIETEGLEDLDTALRRVHFPEDAEQLARATERLKFDELFTLELGVALRKHRLESERAGIAHQADGDADRPAPRDPAVRADEGPDACDRGGRGGDGRRSPDERPPAGRRRLREDAGRRVGLPHRRSSPAIKPPSWRRPRFSPPSTPARSRRCSAGRRDRPARTRVDRRVGAPRPGLPARGARADAIGGPIRSRTRRSPPPSPGRTGPGSSPGSRTGVWTS